MEFAKEEVSLKHSILHVPHRINISFPHNNYAGKWLCQYKYKYIYIYALSSVYRFPQAGVGTSLHINYLVFMVGWHYLTRFPRNYKYRPK